MGRLNLNWPGQQITTETANEWYEALSGFPVREVWDAIDRCRRDLTPAADGRPTGRWLPSLAEILAAIDTNWGEAAAMRRELEAREARAARNAAGGVPMPPETKEALRILTASKNPPGHPDHIPGPVARQRIEALADQLAERVDREKAGQLT